MNSIADVLIERGWYQGDWYADDGRVCLMAAACAAFNINPGIDLIPKFLVDAVADAATTSTVPRIRVCEAEVSSSTPAVAVV